MMTPQHAYRLFVHVDHAMILVGLAALVASIGWGIYAILPAKKKGRRSRTLRKSLISFLVFAMVWGTQASVTIAFFNDQWTPLLVVLFALPVVVMLTGLVASIVYGSHAILAKTGTERRQVVLISLLGVAIFGVGVAPHAAAMLMPFISDEDHSNRPGTLTRIGDPVPDFELATVEGVNFRGRVTVLNFFATWCGPCQKELPNWTAPLSTKGPRFVASSAAVR